MIKLQQVGSDPEFGIVDEKGNPIPSFLFFEGTKDVPEIMGNGFAILKDNLLVEGNIPACSSREEFVDAMKMLKAMISVPLTLQNAKILSADSIDYHEMWIQTPEGQNFGCSSYRNAYKVGVIDTPQMEGSLRDCGFHIHISYENNSGYSKGRINKSLTKAMDYFLGLPSDEIHYSKARRESYGGLGSYRETSYGFEYRSLGGFFTQDKYLEWVYDQTIKALEFCTTRSNLSLLENIGEANKDNYKQLGIDLSKQIPSKKLIEQ